MDECKVIQVIFCSLERRGDGKITPVRAIEQIFDFSGHLLMERDPIQRFTAEDMVEFANQCKLSDISPGELLSKFRTPTRTRIFP